MNQTQRLAHSSGEHLLYGAATTVNIMAPKPIRPIDLHIGPGGACEHSVDLTGVCNTTAARPLCLFPGVGGGQPPFQTLCNIISCRNHTVSQLHHIYDAL